MRIAVVGTGIAGIGAAWLLSPTNTVDVYESQDWLGGHSRTIDVTVDDTTFPVDAGFMVYNTRTYPNLVRLFEHLGVQWQETEMSFSVRVDAEDIEWSGDSLNSVFAQRKNITNPRFLKMLADIVRFSRDADRLLADPSVEKMTLGEMLAREGYRGGFTDWYLIPMGDAIWSTPPGEMLDYPAATFLRFCDNHGLLHITGKPTWRSVVGGARTYVDAAARTFSGEVHMGEPVERIGRAADGVRLHTPRRTEVYDAVIAASHPPDTLAMLGGEAGTAQREVLSAFSYWPNEVVLHTDDSFLPKSRRAWAAWNWYSSSADITKEMLMLSYYINRLQRLPVKTPVIETLNEHKRPARASELARMVFDHPTYSADAIAAQKRLGEIQSVGGVWYAGAWTRYGFHEDGLLSAVRVAERLGAKLPWGSELDSTRTRVIGSPAGSPP